MSETDVPVEQPEQPEPEAHKVAATGEVSMWVTPAGETEPIPVETRPPDNQED